MSERRSSALALVAAAALFAVAVGAYVALREPARPALRNGEPAPDFALPVQGGEPVSLAALRGQVVFVNFWATWCAPCREEAPSLQRLYASLRGQGFVVLGVSIDAPDADAAVDAFVREYALAFPIPRDRTKSVYRAYQAYGVPETFLVGADGRVLERFVGPRNWDDPRYSRAIRRALEAGRGDTEGG